MSSEKYASIVANEIPCKQGAVRAVRFNVDGEYAITCGSDKSLKLWNPYKGTVLKTYTGHGHEVLDTQSSGDSSKIVSCGKDKTIILWDVATGQAVRKYRGHLATVNSVKFNEESTVVISGSVDTTLRCWDCRSKKPAAFQIMDDAKDSISSIQVSAYEILAGSLDGCVRHYDIRNGQLTSDEMGQSITSVRFTGDGQGLLVSCLDSSVRLIDKDTGEILQQYTGHTNKEYRIDCCLDHTDNFVFSGSEDGIVYMWSLVEGQLLSRLEHTSCRVVHSLAPHPSKPWLITAAQNNVYLWKEKCVDEELID